MPPAATNFSFYLPIYNIFPLYSMHREMDEAEAIRPKGNREKKSPALHFFRRALILKAGILHGRGAPVGNGKGESLWNTVLTGIRTAALRCWGWAVCACPRWSRAAPPSTTRAPGRWWTRPCAGALPILTWRIRTTAAARKNSSARRWKNIRGNRFTWQRRCRCGSWKRRRIWSRCSTSSWPTAVWTILIFTCATRWTPNGSRRSGASARLNFWRGKRPRGRSAAWASRSTTSPPCCARYAPPTRGILPSCS